LIKPIKIALWSGPRNISTAMMYSFGNRADTSIVDEPLFGYFLKQTGVWRPSREEVLATMETDASAIIKKLSNPNINSGIYFMKHIANHLIDLDLSFLKDFRNVILTRDPKKVLLSYEAYVKSPTILDLAYEIQLDLINYLKKNNLHCIVLDADQVLKDSERELKKLCIELSIPFDQKMLSWEPGPRKEDGVWAKYWYHNVHKSRGFKKGTKEEADLSSNLEQLYSKSLKIYNKILKH